MAGYGRIKDEELADCLDVWYLKRSGLWETLNHYRETGEKNFVFKAMMYWNIVSLFPILIFTIVGPFFIEKNLEGMTVIFLNPLSTLQMVIKFFQCLWFGIETQSKLLELMKKDFLTCVPPEKRAEAHEILKEAAKRSSCLTVFLFSVNCFTIFLMDVIPIIRSEFFRETLNLSFFGKTKGHNKILGYWVPGNIDDTPYVQLLYVYEFATGNWTTLMLSLVEALIMQNIIMLTAQIKVLMQLMSQVESSTSEDNSKQLLSYVKAHQILTEMGNEMCELYSFTITMQLSTGLIILIIGIFNFFLQGSENGDIVLTLKFMVYTSYTLVEVGIYCYIGSDLENTSEDVCFAIYSCEWYEMNIENRKHVLMTMVRSRRPVALKAAHVYIVNHTVLSDILQMAYSTSMMMSRMLKGKGL